MSRLRLSNKRKRVGMCVLFASGVLTAQGLIHAQVNYTGGNASDYSLFSLYGIGQGYGAPGTQGVVYAGTVSSPNNYNAPAQSVSFNNSGYVGTLYAGSSLPYSQAPATGAANFNASSTGITASAYSALLETTPGEDDAEYCWEQSVSDVVNFTVGSVTNFTINATGGSLSDAGDVTAGTLSLTGGALQDHAPTGYLGNLDIGTVYPTLIDAGQLKPGITYSLNTSEGGVTAYSASLNLKLNFTTPSAYGSGPALTQTGTFASKLASVPNTVNGYGGVAASSSSTSSNGKTLNVSFDDTLSGSDFGNSSAPLFQTAGAPTFLLPEPGGFTQAWDVSTTTALTGTTTLTFDFDPNALAAGTNLSSLEIYHFVNGVWTLPSGEVVNTTTDTITVPVTSFSPFALGLASVPEPGAISVLFSAMALLRRRRPAATSNGIAINQQGAQIPA